MASASGLCSNTDCLEPAGPICSSCKCSRYCGKECQAKHWKAGHKRECKLFAAELAVTEARWKQAEDLCAYFLKSMLPKMEAGPEKQRLLVRALKCRCRVRMRSSHFSGAVDDAREAFNQSGRTDGRASLMLAEAVFKDWEHLTGGGTKCQMDFPTSSLINNHLLEATRLDPSLAEEKKAVARMVVENLCVMGASPDEDRNREEIQTRLERDRRWLARAKLPKCPAQDILQYHMKVFADQRDGSELAGAAGLETLQTLKLRTSQAKAVILHLINKADSLDGCKRFKEELARIERAQRWLNGEKLVVQNVISLQQDVKRMTKRFKGLALSAEQGKEVRVLEKRVGQALLMALEEAMKIVSGKGVIERMRLMDVMAGEL